MAVTLPETKHRKNSKESDSNAAPLTGAVIIGLLLLGYLWLSGTAGAATVESQSQQAIVEQTNYWK